MMKFLLAALMAAFLTACAAEAPEETAQNEQTPCASPQDMTTVLEQRYGETPVWVGSAEDTAIILFVAEGTWSIVVSTVEQACLELSGGRHQVVQ